MQRNTVNPPHPTFHPTFHPVALTNSHCLYLSFPSVPTINCPFCGGINSLPRTSITCPPANVVNTEGEKTRKRTNRESGREYVAAMNVKQLTKPNGSLRFDVLQRPQLVSVLPEQFKLQATESFQFMNQLEVLNNLSWTRTWEEHSSYHMFTPVTLYSSKWMIELNLKLWPAGHLFLFIYLCIYLPSDEQQFT